MEDLQDKLQSILSDPAQMAQVAALAESLGLKPPENGTVPAGRAPEADASEAGKDAGFGLNAMDLTALMSRLTALNGSEERVLNALRPTLSPAGQGRVDRALRAAKLSRLAGQLLRGREGGHV